MLGGSLGGGGGWGVGVGFDLQSQIYVSMLSSLSPKPNKCTKRPKTLWFVFIELVSHPNDCPTSEAKKPEKAINDCKDEEGRWRWNELRHVLRPAQ